MTLKRVDIPLQCLGNTLETLGLVFCLLITLPPFYVNLK